MKVTFLLPLMIACTSVGYSQEILVDVDGNTYRTAGYQGVQWMTENLRATHDRNGNAVTFCYPDSVPASANAFGLLYDYETACNVCPQGWELPSDADWQQLISAFEGATADHFKDPGYWGGEENSDVEDFPCVPPVSATTKCLTITSTPGHISGSGRIMTPTKGPASSSKAATPSGSLRNIPPMHSPYGA